MSGFARYSVYPLSSVLMLLISAANPLRAQAPTPPPTPTPTTPSSQPASPTVKSDTKPPEKKDELKTFEEAAKDTEKLEGMFNLYRKKEKLYLELLPEQLNKPYYCTVTMESGTGDVFLSGLPMLDFLFEFRRVHDNIEIVMKNTMVRTKPDDPVRRAVERAFSESILSSVKVECQPHPERKSVLVDIANPFLTDIGSVGSSMSESLKVTYGVDAVKTRYVSVKTFPLNVELESQLAFGSGKPGPFGALPDARFFTLRLHYSISQLPETNYRPRLADARVGYFVTAYKDFSNDNSKTPFVRYINRRHLEVGSDGMAKQPLVYWLENTIPLEYRDAVRDGVLMWNRAFERIGIKNAIEVRVQPDDATWEADDVRYTTIRWVASMGAGFAMGPSWVNPLTGETLDSDIIIQADMIRYFKQEYRNYVRLREDAVVGSDPELPFLNLVKDRSRLCTIGSGIAREAAFGALAIMLQGQGSAGPQAPKEYVDAYLRDLVAHEVGHTLGLRHNFHGSTLVPTKELQNAALTKGRGLVGSVMDYAPVNLAPKGVKQGEYFPSTVGPYDLWAIEYGYKPITAKTPEEELPELRKIAAQAARHPLAYGTDEDVVGLDPTIERWDLGDDPLAWRKQRMDLARRLLQNLEKRVPDKGESYTDLSSTFNLLFGESYSHPLALTNYIGGQYMHRDHAGDPGAHSPFEPLPVAKQREALKLIQDSLFSAGSFQFSPSLLNKLAPDRWWHWGNEPNFDAPDYPIHDQILRYQRTALFRLTSPVLLRRLRDNEMKVGNTKDTLTLVELFNSLQSCIWSELLTGQARRQIAGKPTISTQRRGLQREYLNVFINLLLQPASGTPEDARTLSWHQLKELQTSITSVLRSRRKQLDTATLAHLEESRQRLTKALEMRMEAVVR